MLAGSRSTRRASGSSFRPDPDWLWGQRYPDAVYHLVTSTPDAIETVGGDELLYADGHRAQRRLRRSADAADARACFAVVGSLTGRRGGGASGGQVRSTASTTPRCWRPRRATGRTSRAACASPATAPDVAGARHDISLARAQRDDAPHRAARPGAIFRRRLGHPRRLPGAGRVPARARARRAGRRKSCASSSRSSTKQRGDWPQWFMLEPYSNIRDRHAHGDVIVWPLKALCDYVEATNDLAFLEEPVAWRRDGQFRARPNAQDPIAAHVDKLLATVRARFIPGTQLLRYGEGDWNDSLQPADPTDARLDGEQLDGRAAVPAAQPLRRGAAARGPEASDARALGALATAMRADFNRHLIRDGTVAGYALFEPGRDEPELLLHPSDTRTGLRYSLLPMTRGIIAGLFTPEQARHHLGTHPRAPAVSRRRAADGQAGRLPRRAGDDLPPRRVGGVLRPRDRPHVRPRASALRRGDGGAGRG